jgi:hypothetical protein
VMAHHHRRIECIEHQSIMDGARRAETAMSCAPVCVVKI